MPSRVPAPRRRPGLDPLLAIPPAERQERGFGHTLCEILQQPELWGVTAGQVSSLLDGWQALAAGANGIVLTGSGSSLYACECASQAVQSATHGITLAKSSGDLLLYGERALPPVRPLVMVSLARSGNSPESSGAIRQMLESETEAFHLVLTCNRTGRVAQEWGRDSRVRIVALDDRTCDRSLVMTSSFSNLAVAALGLAHLDRRDEYLRSAKTLSSVGEELFTEWSGKLAEAARGGFTRLIALGDGDSLGAAHEAALKMLEMTDGRVHTLAETSLGFRHGPMCALREDTLLLMFLSPDPVRRAYQLDVLEEIRRKGLAGRKIVVGTPAPREVLNDDDLAVTPSALRDLPEEWHPIAQVVVAQLLAFFRCLAEGLRPDEPAPSGAISRVVIDFPLHGILNNVSR
jgi:tagatose-6-phosphate ketose/aldose isomerase